MQVDIGNALEGVATPGIPRSALERLDERVATAHDRIHEGMAEGHHGYAALNLPVEVDPDGIRRAVEPLAPVETVLVLGIGGSALGAATVVDALGEGATVQTLDNVDPDRTSRLLDRLELSRTALHVVSRSGTTVETLANLAVVRREMETAGLDWTERTLVTTGSSGPLREMARDHGLPVLDVPTGVPGRYAALSTVGLPAAAMAGIDVEPLLEGAAKGRRRLAGSLFECPAYAYGATAFALAQRGYDVNVMMPYAESLETFAEWFAQLWAESLGKDGLGQIPVRALGVTDQHSQLQLYREGPRSAMLTFLRPLVRESVSIPPTDGIPQPSDGELELATLMDAEFAATEASIAEAGRASVRIEIDRVDGRALGELLLGYEAACIMMAELLTVDAFDQPGVEWAKRATEERLRGSVAEAGETPEKTRLVID